MAANNTVGFADKSIHFASICEDQTANAERAGNGGDEASGGVHGMIIKRKKREPECKLFKQDYSSCVLSRSKSANAGAITDYMDVRDSSRLSVTNFTIVKWGEVQSTTLPWNKQHF